MAEGSRRRPEVRPELYPRAVSEYSIDYESLEGTRNDDGLRRTHRGRDTCMVDLAKFFIIIQDESCGNVAPCRIG